MNPIINFEFSEFSLLTVLILGILLSFFLRIMRRIILPKISEDRLKQMYQIMEILIWVIYGFWALNNVLKGGYYYLLGVLVTSGVIVIWVGWFVVKDFIAGIVLKMGDNYQPGLSFKMDNLQGKIIEAGLLQLSVQQPDQSIVKIPYSKISGAVHYKTQEEDKTAKYRFEVLVTEEFSEEEIRDRIRQAILLSAGACFNREPQIRLMENREYTRKFEVVAFAHSAEYFQLIEKNVKNIFSSLDESQNLIKNPLQAKKSNSSGIQDEKPL